MSFNVTNMDTWPRLHTAIDNAEKAEKAYDKAVGEASVAQASADTANAAATSARDALQRASQELHDALIASYLEVENEARGKADATVGNLFTVPTAPVATIPPPSDVAAGHPG